MRMAAPICTRDQEVQFEISGPGVIAAVGNGDGQDADSYHGDRRKLLSRTRTRRGAYLAAEWTDNY